jgi:hypothetical protein
VLGREVSDQLLATVAEAVDLDDGRRREAIGCWNLAGMDTGSGTR